MSITYHLLDSINWRMISYQMFRDYIARRNTLEMQLIHRNERKLMLALLRFMSAFEWNNICAPLSPNHQQEVAGWQKKTMNIKLHFEKWNSKQFIVGQTPFYLSLNMKDLGVFFWFKFSDICREQSCLCWQ